jgi:hypothetical protein
VSFGDLWVKSRYLIWLGISYGGVDNTGVIWLFLESEKVE